uniref:Monooxygenase n=1 Tax=Coccidioides posadasii RMSCC 3488 TaxID=454284 RepID=A0A0J6FQM3_COCPO|nr:monooxygenase [Coccidioides posadasii RMSCC 3488]
MAPDIASIPTGDNPDINGPESPYQIDQEAVLGSQQRKVKVLTIGAGASGIMMAYKIQKECKNVEHVIYEKNEDIGGTWLENRYPNCACDIPSHAYIYCFAPNPEWPNFYSYSPDIWNYLDRVCNTFDLRKYMTFNTKVIGAYWEEDKGEWRVALTQTMPDGTQREFEERCNVLLNGTGILNNYKWPDLEGMDKFKGRIIHTAVWPKDYQAEQWKNDRVAVIGSGASSIQTVPGMQPHVKHMDVFVRTGVWFTSIAGNEGLNKDYSEEEKAKFRNNTEELVKASKFIENQINGDWGVFYKDSEAQKLGQEYLKRRMGEWIKDERLLKGFTPTFGVGCRRVTPGDPYMVAIQKANVDVHFTAVARFTENGVMGEDGIEREADTVVCATGFDTSYRPRFPIIGEGGLDLRDKWKICPESYLGLGVPGYPNYMVFVGPTWPVENGSVMGPLVEVGNYAIKLIKKIQNEHIHSITPRQDVTDAFNEHAQEWIKHTVWVDDCRSWYKNNETGRVNAVWPGSSLHYIELIKEPRFEDYSITYQNKKNMWSFLGLGKVPANVIPNSDHSPYLSVEAIDPVWLDEIQGRRHGGKQIETRN